MTRSRCFTLGLIAVGLSAAVLLPCTSKVSEDYGYIRSASRLRAIGYALRSYHEAHGKLPPAVGRDKAGRPLYSWRVLLLPYLEEPFLYAKFNLDEPWDSPTNKPLLRKRHRATGRHSAATTLRV
jgi:hypothetical protein